MRQDTATLKDPHRALLSANGLNVESLKFLIRTGTSTDVGQWTGGRRVWLACEGERILLFAAGKRPYFEAIPFAEARDTRYNHIRAEVALGPCEPRVRNLSVPPDIGCRFLDVLGIEYGKVQPSGAGDAPRGGQVV